MRPKWSLLVFVLAVSLAALAGGCASAQPDSLKSVQSNGVTERDEFTVTALGDQAFTLSEQHGNVVVLYLTSFCSA